MAAAFLAPYKKKQKNFLSDIFSITDMISLTATGYVSGKPTIEKSDYGDSLSVGIRCKGDGGKNVFYVNAKFYGKRMAVIEKFISDGDQVTLTGTVGAMLEKTKKDGTKYAQVYMNGAGFSIPPQASTDDAPAPLRPLKSSASDLEEEEVPF